jgi:hypothetical protein
MQKTRKKEGSGKAARCGSIPDLLRLLMTAASISVFFSSAFSASFDACGIYLGHP